MQKTRAQKAFGVLLSRRKRGALTARLRIAARMLQRTWRAARSRAGVELGAELGTHGASRAQKLVRTCACELRDLARKKRQHGDGSTRAGRMKLVFVS